MVKLENDLIDWARTILTHKEQRDVLEMVNRLKARCGLVVGSLGTREILTDVILAIIY